jgi:dTDP-4-dehydrorhamnose 3,5-epimerase
MHIQVEPTENWKVITVIEGHIFDVLVDVRKSSKSYLDISQKYIKSGGGVLLPPGIAHGFQAIESSFLIYCSSRAREVKFDLGFHVQSLSIEWPLTFNIQSERDKRLPSIEDFLNRN